MTERELKVIVHIARGKIWDIIKPYVFGLLAVIALLIVIKIIKNMNTRFKDRWDFSVSIQNAQVQHGSEPVDLAIFGKKRVKLAELLSDGIEPCLDLLAYGGDEDDVQKLQNVLQYWEESAEAKSIVLQPTSKANGFVIVKGKNTPQCSITHGGAPVMKKCYVSGASELVISLAENDYALTLTMNMALDQTEDMD